MTIATTNEVQTTQDQAQSFQVTDIIPFLSYSYNTKEKTVLASKVLHVAIEDCNKVMEEADADNPDFLAINAILGTTVFSAVTAILSNCSNNNEDEEILNRCLGTGVLELPTLSKVYFVRALLNAAETKFREAARQIADSGILEDKENEQLKKDVFFYSNLHRHASMCGSSKLVLDQYLELFETNDEEESESEDA